MESDAKLNTPPKAEEGLKLDCANPDMLNQALTLAFEYRGDVSITLRSDGTTCEGYVFDLTDSAVRLLPQNRGSAMQVARHDIAHLEFTGRDTALGKSFETWIRKYVEKKRAGLEASIASESLTHDTIE